MSSGSRRHPLGSALLGDDIDVGRLRVRVQLLLTATIVIANVIGAVVVTTLALVVIPGAPVFVPALRLVNDVALPTYILGALVVGVLYGTRTSLAALRWVGDGRAPTADDRRRTLNVPWRLAQLQGLLWAGATVIFTTLYGLHEPADIPRFGFPTAFGGLVVCANSYLLAEFCLRPISARALLAGAPVKQRVAGVKGRSVLTWVLGSGVPVAGLVIVAIFSLVRGNITASRLAVSVLALGGVTLAAGLLLTVLGANATVAPLRSVRDGLRAVERGELHARVVVFDGTELGDLQTGFNVMASGLQEREQLRDLFGRHVGRDVAEAALRSTPELGGQECDVAVFFIDIVGSTQLATEQSPTEVVRLLNRFFAVVVDEVEAHGGFINKFAGDGALAVFGAPTMIEDPAGQALAAARRVNDRLRIEVPECTTGTGVAAGRAVAGNVGDTRRFEYTVIGDPVNEAARLADLAKSTAEMLLASGAAVALSSPQEKRRWKAAGEAVLRGRTEATALAVPLAHHDVEQPLP
jgi:adenylate cyclase